MNNLLWVKCRTNNYYQTVKRLNTLNINIYKIYYNENTLYLKINTKDYEKIQKYLVSYKFLVAKDLGIVKIKKIIKQYKEFFICLIIGFILLFCLTHLIVDVKVVHMNKEIRELLTDELESYGIKTLSFKKSYAELQKIKKEILNKYPQKLDWLEFEVDGMLFIVKVEERIITDTTKDNKKCNIVATKDGTISSLKVFQGEALVQENDVVKMGDVLISGIISYNEEEKKRVCAEGDVYAHTWYTVKVNIPLNYKEFAKTGHKKYNLIWVDKNKKTLLLKKRFATYDSNTKLILKLFDYELYLEKEEELVEKELKYSEEEALKVAITKASTNLKKKLGINDEIIDKKVLKKSINDSKMEVEMFIIVNEKISKTIEIEDNTEGIEESDTRDNQNNN